MKIFLLFLMISSLPALGQDGELQDVRGAVIRGDVNCPRIALVFTGHEYAEGGSSILNALQEHSAKASFFLTGDFYRNKAFGHLIAKIREQKHYLGAHSDRHLLYCDWENRDSLLVNQVTFTNDLQTNYREMQKFGIVEEEAIYYLPPYEWYNDSISQWTREIGLRLVNFTPGTRSNADYTIPGQANYVESEKIFHHILNYEEKNPNGLNGFILLLHIGVGPERNDKFHKLLPDLLKILKERGYELVTIDQLLKN